MTRLCIIERGATEIPRDHPLVQSGGVLPADVTACDFNAGAPNNLPADDRAEMLDLWAAFPERPRVLKLHGAGKASWDALNPDTYLKATPEQLFPGLEAGRIDVAPDWERLREFAELCRGGPRPSHILVDDEPGSIVWKVVVGDDHPQKAIYDDAARRRDDLLVAIFQSNKCRKQLGPACQSVPRDPAGILAAFGEPWPPPQGFDAIQMEVERWWQKLRAAALKDLLQRAGWYPGAIVVHAFVGAHPVGQRWNSWIVPKVSLAAGWASNWQCYDGGRLSPRQLTRWCYAASKAPRWIPTWCGSDEPDDIEDRLTFCSPNGAILWCPNLDKAARLAGVVKAFARAVM